jgi:hypothetical protein
MINRHYSENYLFNRNNFNSYSYQKINPKKQIPRWDKLYQLDKKKRETLKLKEQKIQEEKNRKEIEECTFKPIINKNSEYINKQYYSNNEDSNKEKVSKFFSRQQNWNRKKIEKIEGLTKGAENKELNECRFQPKIVKKY